MGANDTIEMEGTTAEKAYDTVLELFENPEPSQAWADEFNKAARAMEYRCDDGIDEGLPTTNHVLPWTAWLGKGRLYIASPPMVLKGASVRLTLDVMQPLNGTHINVHAIPCDPNGEMLDKVSNANTACLIIDKEAGPAMIFAGWDFVAREGIDAALKAGAIVQSWVQVVTSKVPCVDISTAEEIHATKMLGVYAADRDVDRASIEYRKVFKGSSYESMKAAVKYNKLRYHLDIECNGTEIELEQVRLSRESMAPRAYVKWLLDGVQITYETIKDAFIATEREIYGSKRAALAARKVRIRDITTIVNARMPGDGLPIQIIPFELTFSTFIQVKPDSSTNRTSAIREALSKVGRSEGFDGQAFKDVSGVLCSEIFTGSKIKASSPYEYNIFDGVVVDVVRTRSARYTYETCLKSVI